MIIISFDPGFSGGIAIIDKDKAEVFNMPVIKTQKKKKSKTEYNYLEICHILKNTKKKYSKKNIELCIEKVSTRPQEGNVSAFNFGQGFGCLLGICTAIFDKNPALIYPQSWKKTFSKEFQTHKFQELTEDIKLINEEIKKIKLQIKETNDEIKIIEDKETKKQYKKQVIGLKKDIDELKKNKNKLNNSKKTESKKQSRIICENLYPDLKSEFKRVKDDGKSDALLIGLHYRKILENEK